MPRPLEVTKRHEGQRVTLMWQPATQTNRDPNHDKTLARSNQPRTSETYRRQDYAFGYDLQFLLSGVLPIFQNLNYKLRRRLSDVLPNQQCHQKAYKRYSSSRRVTRRIVVRHFTGHDTNHVDPVHQTSLFHTESNSDRLGLLSPTHGQRSRQQSGQITLQSVLINKPKFLKATHHT